MVVVTSCSGDLGLNYLGSTLKLVESSATLFSAPPSSIKGNFLLSFIVKPERAAGVCS